MNIAKKLLRVKQDYDNIYNQFDFESFWDKYQDYGNRRNYDAAFSGFGWVSPQLLQPKYPIIVESSYQMFGDNRLVFDLRKYNITFNLKSSNSGQWTFYGCYVIGIPCLDFSAVNGGEFKFFLRNVPNLKVVENLILNDSLTYSTGWIYDTPKLEKLIVSGSIGNSIDFPCNKLNKESLISIVNTLSNEVLNKTVTLSTEAVNLAFETSSGLLDGIDSEEWTSLMSTKSNWTFAYQ